MIEVSGINHNWKKIIRPVGKQPLPEWVRGAHINWWEGYGNAPTFDLLTTGEVFTKQDNKIWSHEGNYYILEQSDGRVQVHKHNGPHVMVDGVRMTTQQEGYGGSHFEIMLEDGPLVLRGPWAVGFPRGCTAVYTYQKSKYKLNYNKPRQPWWKNTGRFGLSLRTEVLIAVLAHYLPEQELAWVWSRNENGEKTWLEPIHSEWGMPKTIYQEAQAARRAFEYKLQRETREF